jgi:tetratricopeptide (TPR) repeat protein
MKRKGSAGATGSPAKGKKTKVVTKTTGRVLQMSSKPQSTRPGAPDAGYAQAVQAYQEGLRALQERKFERAKNLFQKVVSGGPRELADRAKVHLNTCIQHLEQASTNFRGPEEHYDYAVSLINVGDYVGAREHLDRILKQAPKADYAWYGMAVLDCLTGHFAEALKGLGEAIRLNPANRFQARNDSDFNNLADDPRFTELLYPENDLPSATPPGARR